MADLYASKQVTADASVKAGRGFLHNVLVSSVTTAGTLTIYDSADESGTEITAIPLTTRAAGAPVPISLLFDAPFKTGCYFGYDGSLVAEFLVSFR